MSDFVDTILCNVRDGDMNIVADTLILYSEQCGCGPCVDIDGNVYETIQIGDQCWMAENLRVTHYRDGTPIPEVTDDTAWAGLSSGAYCSYNNDDRYVFRYGQLYNWYAVDDARGLAPDGWHVPTDEEFKELEIFLGMSVAAADSEGFRGTNEGSKLAGGFQFWENGFLKIDEAFGESGFKAYPSGYRSSYTGPFGHMYKEARFWTTTLYASESVRTRYISYSYSTSGHSGGSKEDGYSIRCVRD